MQRLQCRSYRCTLTCALISIVLSFLSSFFFFFTVKLILDRSFLFLPLWLGDRIYPRCISSGCRKSRLIGGGGGGGVERYQLPTFFSRLFGLVSISFSLFLYCKTSNISSSQREIYKPGALIEEKERKKKKQKKKVNEGERKYMLIEKQASGKIWES